MKKKSVWIGILVTLVLVIAAFWVGTGLHPRSDVALIDYSLSADGTTLTFTTTVPTSMGYIRGYQNHGGGVKPHYLTFYSTFGGLNSRFGAKNQFTLALDEDDSEIYFNRPDGGYELVLQKEPQSGTWKRP